MGSRFCSGEITECSVGFGGCRRIPIAVVVCIRLCEERAHEKRKKKQFGLFQGDLFWTPLKGQQRMASSAFPPVRVVGWIKGLC